MKIKPLRDRIIVERIEESEKTAGGIYIPDSAKEKPQRGRVLSVGEGRTLDNGQHVKPVVKSGDEVLFGKYSGTEVSVDGSEYLIMREDDILGIVQ